MKLKEIVKKTFLYGIYRKVRKTPAEKFDSISRRNLLNNGFSFLVLLEEILNQSDIQHFFDFGTLLGLVRESGIIKGDGDIDIGIFINDTSDIEKLDSLLKNRKIRKLRQFEIDEYGISEQSYSFDNKVRFDLHFYYRENNSRYCFLFYCLPDKVYHSSEFDVVKVVLKDFNIVPTKIGNYILSLPESPEDILIQKYGDSWRIPNGSWPYWDGPCSVKTELIGRNTLFVK